MVQDSFRKWNNCGELRTFWKGAKKERGGVGSSQIVNCVIRLQKINYAGAETEPFNGSPETYPGKHYQGFHIDLNSDPNVGGPGVGLNERPRLKRFCLVLKFLWVSSTLHPWILEKWVDFLEEVISC